jgi:acetylornithine deacetylase
VNDAELLALHREMVAIPSPSGNEGPLADHVARRLESAGVETHRLGNNLFAAVGRGPVVCLNSHLDTVPASPAWTRAPYEPAVVDGRVFGLGSNDAKAAAAAMTAAFLRLAQERESLDVRVLLALAAEEEVGSRGSEALVPELVRRDLRPDVVFVGEPTGLDVATAQKGLLVLELHGKGNACHAAHGRALGAPNAIRNLAYDLVALGTLDLGPDHPRLGPVTVEPTMVSGGTARNMVPAVATCILDVRTNPDPGPDEIVARVRAAITGEVGVLSQRLRPYEIAADHPLVKAALGARPGAKTFASRGLSDLVFFTGIPGVKVGPGESERSHTPDEYVLESEILEGACFYEKAVRACRGFLVAGRLA